MTEMFVGRSAANGSTESLEDNKVQPKPPAAEYGYEAGIEQNLPFSTPYADKIYEIFREEEESTPTVRQLVSMRRSDGQARALYRLLSLPIRSALRTATFVPAEGGDSEAEFIDQMFTLPAAGGGMQVPFQRVMAQMIMSIFDGFAAFEQVYWSPKVGPLKGKITLQKLAHRPSETLTFLTDDHGGFAGLRQRATVHGRVVDIAIPKSDAFYVSCLAGDTKIALLDGSNVPIQELVGRDDVWVYSATADGSVVPGKVRRAWKTGRRRVVGVQLDNGQTVRCTPDHRWMMRDGTYQEAQHLVSGDSLMPLYRKHAKLGRSRKPYEQVYDPATEAWKWTHRVVADYFHGPGKTGWVIHHINVNAFDNSPNNLARITTDEHYAIHKGFAEKASAVLTDLWSDPEWRAANTEKIRAAMGSPEVRAKLAELHNSQEWRDGCAERVRASNTHGRKDVTFELIDAEYCREPRKLKAIAAYFSVDSQAIRIRVKAAGYASWSAYVADRAEFGSYGVEIAPEVRAASSARMKAQLAELWADPAYRAAHSERMSEQMQKLWADEEWNATHSARLSEAWERTEHRNRRNHKVLDVVWLGEEDVYDLEVDKYHNFALTDGAFVHNCQEEERPFYGVSFFQSSFFSYDRKVKLYFIAHLAAQRAAVGMRDGSWPMGASEKDKNNFKKALADIGVAQYIAHPENYKVNILQEQGSFDFLSYINHHNSQMSKSVLASFFDSNQGGGSSDTALVNFGEQSDAMFIMMLQTIMDDLASAINNWLIPKFVDWNFASGKYPTFTWGKFTDEQKAAVQTTFDKLAAAGQGVNVTPEFLFELEKKMAEEIGLEIDYVEIAAEREAEKAAQQQADSAMEGGQFPSEQSADPASAPVTGDAPSEGVARLEGPLPAEATATPPAALSAPAEPLTQSIGSSLDETARQLLLAALEAQVDAELERDAAPEDEC